MLMEGRVALVTGASRGIGAATARLLARHGAAVGVNYYHSEAAAQSVVDEIRAAGGKALPVQADVREERQVQEMVAEVTRVLGPIDTLVINASIGFPVVPFVEYSWEAFEAKLVGELRGAFFTSRAVVPGMIERKGGCIVAVSSGLSKQPGQGFVAHSTAKSGLNAFIESLALELGPHGIRANLVAPGLTLTDATAFIPEAAKQASAQAVPMRRNGLPEDVAGAVLALAAGTAGFVTGAYLPVSGGAQIV